jgi:hypothetical protein
MSRTTLLVLSAVILVLALAQPARAFGAGNIPSFAYLEGKGEACYGRSVGHTAGG